MMEDFKDAAESTTYFSTKCLSKQEVAVYRTTYIYAQCVSVLTLLTDHADADAVRVIPEIADERAHSLCRFERSFCVRCTEPEYAFDHHQPVKVIPNILHPECPRGSRVTKSLCPL